MCPATEKYLTPYIDKNKQPIRIDGRVAADVEKNARSVLALAKRGAKVIFPDVFTIFQGLEQQLQQAKEELSALSAELDKPSILAQRHRPMEQTEHTVKQHTDHVMSNPSCQLLFFSVYAQNMKRKDMQSENFP